MMKMNTKTGSSTAKAASKFITFRNRLNGEIVMSPRKSKSKFIDGVEFIEVISKGQNNYMRKDNLEFISN